MQGFSRYSADVELWLILNGRQLALSHLWHDGFIARERIVHPPTEAEVVLTVDGREHRWPVFLPDGLSPEREETRYCIAA